MLACVVQNDLDLPTERIIDGLAWQGIVLDRAGSCIRPASGCRARQSPKIALISTVTPCSAQALRILRCRCRSRACAGVGGPSEVGGAGPGPAL
jgi:hypothetical protein